MQPNPLGARRGMPGRVDRGVGRGRRGARLRGATMSFTALSFVWLIHVGTRIEIENEIENENENENGALRVTLAGATQEMDAKADQLRWEPRAPDPANAGPSKDPTRVSARHARVGSLVNYGLE